jgi:hypothetical protein
VVALVTEFRNIKDARVAAADSVSGRFFCRHSDGRILKYYPSFLRFTVGGFSPAVTNGFSPPADNPHSHNDSSKPGYDPRCQPAPPVPARFSVICECGRGYFLEATEGDLRVNPAMIVEQFAQALELAVLARIVDPAVKSRLGHIVATAAREELRGSGFERLLAEIPARGATAAQHSFCAQFIPPFGGVEMPYGTCKFCGCTDAAACEGGCSWINPTHTVCSNPVCVRRSSKAGHGNPAKRIKKKP